MAADRDVRTRVESLLHAVLLGLMCFGVYANAYDHAFNLDSPHVIVSNPKVRELSLPRV